MGKHLPADWTGPTTFCQVCGHDAPDVPRTVAGEGPRECSSCYIGRVINEACSKQEAIALRVELNQEIKRPSTPWFNPNIGSDPTHAKS